MSARHWTFASLLLVGAACDIDSRAAVEVAESAPSAAAHPVWGHVISGRRLEVTMALANPSDRAVTVLSTIGATMAPQVTAAIGGVAIPAMAKAKPSIDPERSRIGVLPNHEVLPAGATTPELRVGFDLPEGYAGEPVEVTLLIELDGEPQTFVTVLSGESSGGIAPSPDVTGQLGFAGGLRPSAPVAP